jgi:phosphoribosylformylglycinamidine synthase subunit PurL
MDILNASEYNFLKESLGRHPNELEQHIVNAEWSEHCSYKSSKIHLRTFPTDGDRVIKGRGYDAGVIDVGNGYVITVHIESHNHPSAVEPHGGAATGVGGVLRDILSMGTRPIALLDALRFGNIDNSNLSSSKKNQWLLKNVVRGIADYGNCIGVPTVGGEVEFDSSFDNYCLVDVASIGYGKKSKLINNKAKKGDIIILAGNPTGKDGIHGASFASSNLDEENRSAVQIPDPFLEKTLLEATMEAIDKKCIKALKDLGGGGLSCCLSETADSLKKGFEIEISNVHLKHHDITDTEIMISESQERMLYVTSNKKKIKLFRIFDEYNIKYSVIGKVNNNKNLIIRNNGKVVAKMPSKLIAHAPLLDRPSEKPRYLDNINKSFIEPNVPKNLQDSILSMISDPSLSSKKWVYQQFDYEVGIRTVSKPGFSDSSVLKLDNGRFITFNLDGNSKHCYIDPYQGTLGCLAESVRNSICVGAEPIGIVDHLQFGNPENEQIFWTFLESVKAIRDFCNYMKIPVVGGKVSLYNETKGGPIKPSPVIGTIGLIENKKSIRSPILQKDDQIFIIGMTNDELGGSEYYEHYHKTVGGKVPTINLTDQKKVFDVIKTMLKTRWVSAVHDCSKGGVIISLVEMSVQSDLGITVDINKMPNTCKRVDHILFSETHNRFILSTKHPDKIKDFLSGQKIQFANIGTVTDEKNFILKSNDSIIFNIPIPELIKKYEGPILSILEKNTNKIN